MRKTSKIILVTLFATMLLLGLGYAAIQNITLSISGTAAASAVQGNFDVGFTEVTEISDEIYVNASVNSNVKAIFNVSGLTQKGQTAYAIYEITNNSSDLSTDLSVETSNSNTEYFTISSRLADTSLVAGDSTTVTVTVELTKTPIEGEVSSTIGVVLTAMPVEPGKEGTSSDINDFSQVPVEPIASTLADVTLDNIGDYIDLRNNLVKTSLTTDDWRILYADDNAVYLILSDYLPNESNYARNAGLEIMGQYGVYSNKDTETLLTALKTPDNWIALANGIDGANALGVPYASLIVASYLSNYPEATMEDIENANIDFTNRLYVVKPETVDGCTGDIYIDDGNFGKTDLFGIYAEEKRYQETLYDNVNTAIRPVIVLSRNTEVVKEGNLWRIPVENTNGITNGYAELTNDYVDILDTTVASITNDCIGQYIDIGNNIIRTESTADDWRILYANDNFVYAVLTEPLPNSTGYAEGAGLLVAGDYGVYEATGAESLNSKLLLSEKWNGLTNGLSSDGKSGAFGSYLMDLFLLSYNEKMGTNITYEDIVNDTTYEIKLERSNLFATEYILDDKADMVWVADNVDATKTWAIQGALGYIIDYEYTEANTFIRPVICISKDRACSYIDGTWIVNQD